MTVGPIPAAFLTLFLSCGALRAQLAVGGRVVDETGGGVSGARIEIRKVDESALVTAVSSDPAGNFSFNLPAAGAFDIRAERLGFFVFRSHGQKFDASGSQLTITLNHQQEFSERIDVSASPPAIDPQQPAEHKELDNAEILAVPYPAPQDYRNALQLFDGVVQDNSGRFHFNGAAADQANYTLDGFNIANPVTGQLDTRVNIDSIQSMTVQNSRFSAENGRGSAGTLDLATRMGDDHLRFSGTNFVPGISSDGGWHVNKWTPRLKVSGPISKGRAWFHNGADVFYSDDVVHGLPRGQDRTHGTTLSDLTRLQVNLTPSNILSTGFLLNMADNTRTGLSFLNPAEATTNSRQLTFLTSIRDQQYFARGALLDVGFADTRGMLRSLPQGTSLYEITPYGERGNYFENLDRHFYRQQALADLFLPTLHLYGTHQLKFGTDFEREAFHQTVQRHDYEVLLADNSVARYVTFGGNPFTARKNFEGAYYFQDHWQVLDTLSVEAGVRLEWNEIVRDLEVAPRLSASWAPAVLGGTKLSAGWGIYYDAISLDIISRQQDQTSFATFYLPGGIVHGPVPTAFQVDEQSLHAPYYRTSSLSAERKLPWDFYGTATITHRSGAQGFAFETTTPISGADFYDGATYTLHNQRADRYDAVTISMKRTFAGKYEWFGGYTRSNARTNAAVEYSLQNPVFAAQVPGRLAWDTPNRVHMWGWVPVPHQLHPKLLDFVTRNMTAAYLVEYRTGFPFSVVDQEGFLVGRPNERRFPDYFSVNLHFERQFRAIHYVWAWRFGFDNITNNGNPNFVNNVLGTPQFLTYARGQARAFSVRLRFLGRR
jgi:hypothetical protein